MSMTRPHLLALTLLGGCAYLQDNRDPPQEIDWSGYVLVDPVDGSELINMTEGSVTMVDLGGEPIAEATQPYAASPGWWTFADLAVDTEVAIRVQGPEGGEDAGGDTADSGLPDTLPTVWRGTVPKGPAFWMYRGLFTLGREAAQATMAAAAELGEVVPGDLSEGQVAHLWGQPWDPETWIGVQVRMVNAYGDEVPVLTLATDEETGELVLAGDGPVEIFFAFNLLEGESTLEVRSTGGEIQTTVYPTRGGDLLSAFYIGVPEDSP
jgi:hypothetical protein